MRMRLSPPNRDVGFLDVLGLVGLAGLALARWVPVARLVPFWGCPLREATGWPCLGCGLTRVAERVAHGQLAGAWDANPLGTVAALLFALAGLWTLAHLAFRVPVPEVSLTPREAWALRWALGVAVAVNYAWVVLKTRFPHLL